MQRYQVNASLLDARSRPADRERFGRSLGELGAQGVAVAFNGGNGVISACFGVEAPSTSDAAGTADALLTTAVKLSGLRATLLLVGAARLA